MYMSPFIYIGFRNTAIRSYALLDTGARCNVISHELVDQIPNIAKIEETKCFQLTDKGTVTSVFFVLLPVMVNGREYKHKFYVLPYNKASHKCILGVPWLIKHRVHVNLLSGRAVFTEQSFHVPLLTYEQYVEICYGKSLSPTVSTATSTTQVS